MKIVAIPYVHVCKDMKAYAVIEKLTDLFSMLGFPDISTATKGFLCHMNLNYGFTVCTCQQIDQTSV